MSEQGRECCAGGETRKIFGRYDLISVVSSTKHGFSRNRMERTGMPPLQHSTSSSRTSDIHCSESEARKCCFTPSVRNDRFSVLSLSSFDGTSSLISIIVQQEGARPLQAIMSHTAMEPDCSLKDSQKEQQRSWSHYVLGIVAICFSIFLVPIAKQTTTISIDPHSIYVPGGGFSGFWFTLGRLQSIPDLESKNFYCYSAGCLGVVAALSNYTVMEMSDMAFGIQQWWKDGHVDRYGVVDAFLNRLLTERPIPLELLSRIYIITSTRSGTIGLVPSIQNALSTGELHRMLLQTTWIPLATGSSFWNNHHMDGAFTAGQHPKCAHTLHLPKMLNLYMNVINVNLSAELVHTFWETGLNYGVP